MELSKELLDGFAEITHDKKEKITDVTCYGTANLHDGEYVQIDGANELTPASFAVSAHDGDRVMVLIKNHSATVIANITTPSMTLGILKVTDGIIVQGYLTTNSARTTYNDQTVSGLTFSAGGIGAYGGSSGKYWYVTNGGDLYASSAEIIGNITAESGYLGTAAYGFHIDQYGIYSGNPNKSGVTSGEIALSNSNFSRTLGGTLPVANLRFAIGGNFGVDDTGKLYAAGAQIAGDIIAYSGYIGTATNGFHINEYGIYSGTQGISPSSGDITLSTGSFERLINNLSVQNLRFAIGSNFGVDANGELYASNAHISGRFDATLGSIANWQIGSNAIYRSNTGTTAAELFDTAGILYFGDRGISLSNTFKVTNDGVITATSGSIGGWKLDDNAIYRGANSVPQLGTVNTSYFGINGLWVSDRFTVDSVGNLHATNADVSGVIKAASGEIGSGTNKILLATSGNNAAIKYGMDSYGDTTHKGFYIGTDGFALGGGAFTVSSTGVLTTSSGYIAEWVINGRGLYSEKTVSNVTYRAGLQSVGSTDAVDSRKAFLVEQTSNSTTTDKFYVRYDGYLYASSANITGEITASRLTLTNGTKVSTNDISGLKPVATSGSFNDLNDKTGAITTDNIGGYFTTYSNTINASNILYRGDVTIEEIPPTDNSGVTTTRFTYKNTAGEPVTRETKTSANGEYILIDVPVGVVPTGRPTSSATVGILVDTTGFLKASNALIYGTIYATDGIFNGTIYAGAGEIGGWTIGSKAILREVTETTSSGTYYYKAYMNAPDSITPDVNNAFAVQSRPSGQDTWDNIFAVRYDGYLVATSGRIGGWMIGNGTKELDGSLYYKPSGSSFGSNGTILFNPKGVTNAIAIGYRSATDWVITAGSGFGVTNSGYLYVNTASIGGFSVSGESISSTVNSISNYFGVQRSQNTGYAISIAASYTSGSIVPSTGVFRVTNKGTIDSDLYMQNTSLTKGSAPSSETNRQILFTDSGGTSSAQNDLIGAIYCGALATNEQHFINRVYAPTTANSNYIEVKLGYPTSGSPYCKINGLTEVSSLGTNYRTGYGDGVAGVYATSDGAISLSHATAGGTLAFMWAKATSPTAKFTETASGVITLTGALTVTNGISSTSNIVATASSATERYVKVVNTLHEGFLDVNASGTFGLWSGTKSGWVLYVTKDADNTDSNLYIPRDVNVTGSVTASSSVLSGGNLEVGLSSAVQRTVTVFNDKASVSLRANSDGNNIGLIANKNANTTRNSWMIYMDSSGDVHVNGNATTATTAGNVTGTVAVGNGGTGATSASAARTNLGAFSTSGGAVSGHLATNSKTAASDGNAGAYITETGNIYLINTSGSSIYFNYAKATSYTSRIYESSSGVITVDAGLIGKDYGGNSRRITTSFSTDGQRVAGFGVSASTLYIACQSGTAGSTYANKTVAISSSDIRLKTNITKSEVNALSLINAIPVRAFDWTDGRLNKHQSIGMVADELEKMDSRLATGGGCDEDGNMIVKSVDTFYLVGYLVKAVQELSAEIKKLKGAA